MNLEELKQRAEKNASGYEVLVPELEKLEAKLQDPAVWADQKLATEIGQQVREIKDKISLFQGWKTILEDAQTALEIGDEELIKESESSLAELEKQLDKYDIQQMLSGEYDDADAFLSINAGAGGTDAQDWANMLLRMYIRWAETRNWKVELVDKSDGEEAGIKSATIKISGKFAYGYAKAEKGVHRLVRISPFDSNKRRHTSFASIEVMPEFDKNINIEINENDLRIDIYRSSGPGGQGVNTTDSAVRITHIPTKIVVTCQNERSQIKNKEQALNILKSKLFNLELEKQNNKISQMTEGQMSIAFGSGKRSYVMCPYTLVKDNDTNYETSDVNKVLDGEIEEFINQGIRSGKNA